MTGSDQIEAVFAEALMRPEDERPGYLREACRGDAALASRIERLLRAHDRGTRFLESPPTAVAGAIPRTSGPAVAPHTRLGAYELLELLGEGGMGSVWLARRADAQYEKLAAIKLIKRGMDTDALLRRFSLERRVLALLEHPNVARLLDAGATEDGRPFLVMEHVRGERIDRWCDARRLPVRARIELFTQVCAAVQHAHGLLVVHRDIKPGNILVGHDGIPKLLDFGIAKVLADDESQGVTVAGDPDRLLTPQYASPEQIRAGSVTTATDVYGLGAVLYELLVGRAAHGRTRETLVGAVKSADRTPPLPSSAVDADSAALRGTSAPRLVRQLRGDLDTIVLKALHPEPARRYAGAGELLDDLRRYLERLPVRARRDSPWYRARKFVARNPLPVGFGCAMLAALVIGLVVSLWMYGRAEHERALAERSEYTARLVAAEAAIRGGDFQAASSRLAAAPASLRGWEWLHLQSRVERRLAQMDGHVGLVLCGAFSADGKLAATGGADGRVLLWDGESGERRGELARHAGEVYGLSFSPGSDLLATACADRMVRLWKKGDNGWMLERELPAHASRATAVAFGPTGSPLVSMDLRGTLRVWGGPHGDSDIDAFEEITSTVGHTFAMARSGDGRWLAVGAVNGDIHIFDLSTRAAAGTLGRHGGSINALAFSPDGRTLASSSQDRTARLWDFAGESAPGPDAIGRLRVVLAGHNARVDGLAFSHDGLELYSVSWDRTVRAWDAETGRPLRIVGGSPGQMRVAALDPAGTRLLTAGDAGASLWDPRREDVPQIVTGMANVDLALSPDGRLAIAATLDRRDGASEVWAVWDLHRRVREGVIACPGGATSAVAVSADSSRWLRGRADGVVEQYRIGSDEPPAPIGSMEGRVRAVIAHRNDVIAVSESGHVRRWSTRAGGDPSQSAAGTIDNVRVRSAAIDASGALLAVGGEHGALVLLDAASLLPLARRTLILPQVARASDEPERAPGRSTDAVRAVAFSPDGQLIAAAGDDGIVHILRAGDLGDVVRLDGHTDVVHGLHFSRDGSRLASASTDRTVRIWRVERAASHELLALYGHGFTVWSTRFVPAPGGGESLVSASGDNTLRVWQALVPSP